MKETALKGTYRNDVLSYAAKQYGTSPDFPWAYLPSYAVLRHQDNRKWYALIMDIPRSKLGLPGDGRVDILNVKLDDPLLVDLLIQQEGYLRYHAGQGNWISIRLDGSVPRKDIYGLIDKSFLVTASKRVRGMR